MHSTVAVIGCESYDDTEVLASVRRGLELLGGISNFARQGETILLKPNLLAGDPPEKALTTHPAVFKAVARVFQEGGANVVYGDSPALAKPERAAKLTGLQAAAQEIGVPLADFKTGVKVSFPDALLAKQLILAAGALDADGIVTLPKMKTHGFTRITGSVKNQFGCLPGLQKAEFHVKMPDIYDFSRVLVDINRYLKMRLSIMDGIVAMEGNGPRSGEPIPMNVLIFSADLVAVDAVFCRLIDMDPEFVPTMALSREAGLGTYKDNEISLVGDDIEGFIKKDFKAVRQAPYRYISAQSFPTFLKNWVSPRPVIDSSNCVLCGQCVQMCPVSPKAVDFHTDTKTKNKKHPPNTITNAASAASAARKSAPKKPSPSTCRCWGD